jgi:regulator of cell morphogenesis and NO signaling
MGRLQGHRCVPDSGKSLEDFAREVLEPMHRAIDGLLPALRDLSARVLQRHGDAYHDVAVPVLKLIEYLREEVERRHVDEGHELFPLIDALARGDAPGDAADRLARLRWLLDLDQLAACEVLEKLRALTSEYHVPPDACMTVRELYRGLERLDRALRTELLLENTVLFPRAMALATCAHD